MSVTIPTDSQFDFRFQVAVGGHDRESCQHAVQTATPPATEDDRGAQLLGQYDSVNDIFAAIHAGEPDAEKQLFAKVYDELRRMARGRLRWEKPGISLHTTALVHEAYFNLVGEKESKWQNRAHFFGAAAEAMRRILVQRARYHGRQKRGGDFHRIPLQDNFAANERSLDLVALDEALLVLEKLDPRKCQVVKYRYFLGLTVPETAELLQVSARTVDNDWQLAKSWLKRELSKGDTLVSESTPTKRNRRRPATPTGGTTHTSEETTSDRYAERDESADDDEPCID